MLKAIIAIAALAAAMTHNIASAHDLVLIPEPNRSLTVRYGHVGDWLYTDEMRLVDLTAISTDNQERVLRRRAARRGVDLSVAAASLGAATLVAGRYDNGAWVETTGADGKPEFRNASPLMVRDARSSLWSLKFAKGLFGAAGDTTLYNRAVGHLLEIIPERNPASLKPGDELSVLVRFDGKPLAGARVELGDLVTKIDEDKIVRFTTDDAGLARVTIRKRGLQLLAVDLELPNDGSLGEAAKKLGVDKLLIVATYVFRL